MDKMIKIDPSEITPEHVYMSRRKFIKGAGALIAGSLILSACGQQTPLPTSVTPKVTTSPKTTSGTSEAPTATPEPSKTPYARAEADERNNA